MKKEKLRLEDLKVGLGVYKSQLSNIYDTYILLRDFDIVEDDLYGVIDTITPIQTLDARDKILSGKTYCVYNDREDLEGDSFYEE